MEKKDKREYYTHSELCDARKTIIEGLVHKLSLNRNLMAGNWFNETTIENLVDATINELKNLVEDPGFKTYLLIGALTECNYNRRKDITSRAMRRVGVGMFRAPYGRYAFGEPQEDQEDQEESCE